MDKELLHLFFAQKATQEQEQEILNWLDKSPDNYKILLEERKIFDLILISHKNVKNHKRYSVTHLRVIDTLKYAAILLIAIGISSLYDNYKRNELFSTTTSISTPAGQKLSITLPDGTTVKMNSSTTLEYPSIFSENERVIKLDGEIYLDVKRDSERPFIVETKFCDIEVLGTEFNVNAYSDDSKIITSLVSGKVKVTNTNGNSIVLNPNQMAISSESNLTVEEIYNDNYLSWRDGVLSFSNASFYDLIAEFERHYAITILIEPSFETSKKSITGKVRISDGINHAMELLQNYTKFNYSRDYNENTITIRN